MTSACCTARKKIALHWSTCATPAGLESMPRKWGPIWPQNCCSLSSVKWKLASHNDRSKSLQWAWYGFEKSPS